MYDLILHSHSIARLCLGNLLDDFKNSCVLVFDCPLPLTARSIDPRNSHRYAEGSGRFAQSLHKCAFDATLGNTEAQPLIQIVRFIGLGQTPDCKDKDHA